MCIRDSVVVALGADGAPCNNNLDALVELRHAALLSKVRAGTTTLPAREALRMATIDGARALGIDDRVGSLTVGKRADVTVVDVSGPHCEPGGDVEARVVYAAQSRDVRHVVVDGRVAVQNREVRFCDAERVVRVAREEGAKVFFTGLIGPPARHRD